MGWNTHTGWTTGQIPAASDFNAINLDFQTWGGNVNANNNALSGLSGLSFQPNSNAAIGGDGGFYFTGISSGSGCLAVGAYYNGSNWVARNAAATIWKMSGGSIYVYSDTGLTVGSTYTPTLRAILDSSGNLTVNSLVVESWTSINNAGGGGTELKNSWVAYGSPYQAPQFMKDRQGRVFVRGAIKSGTTTDGTLVVTLPAGYRPGSTFSANITGAGASLTTLPQVLVDSSGNISVYGLASVAATNGVWLNVNFSTT